MMDESDLWTLFRETGEPMCWILGRAARKDRQEADKPDLTASDAPASTCGGDLS